MTFRPINLAGEKMRNLEFWLHSEHGMRGIMARAHAPNNS
jgi:hypothetical protein